ncbi:MAG: hypothetical protein JJ927_09425 [Balneola sp.]|nr:hypothetical protein [Balneola sp.]MBO6651235.1 hypothetical protein [Balneola sp.]MBO6712030.1 hypothetical protein [Balneola sp.]
MMYTLKRLRRLYLTKVAVIFTIATFLLNQAVEALVVAEIFPVWALRFSLIVTAITFPFVMYIAYVIIYKKHTADKESFEDRILNFWLLIFSILVLGYAVIERFYHH